LESSDRMNLQKCLGGCGETLSHGYEVDLRNERVTSVIHTAKRCMELVRCRKGLKPRPATETTLDSF
jgi:hypothetical protein